MDCISCRERKITARQEKIIKRLVIALIVAIVLFVFSNLAWLTVWNKNNAQKNSGERNPSGIYETTCADAQCS